MSDKNHTINGDLLKYTNWASGYQSRFFVVNEEKLTLEYYLTQSEFKKLGNVPRGVVSLYGASISPDPESTTCFTVNPISSEPFKLKASNTRSRHVWITKLRSVSYSESSFQNQSISSTSSVRRSMRVKRKSKSEALMKIDTIVQKQILEIDSQLGKINQVPVSAESIKLECYLSQMRNLLLEQIELLTEQALLNKKELKKQNTELFKVEKAMNKGLKAVGIKQKPTKNQKIDRLETLKVGVLKTYGSVFYFLKTLTTIVNMIFLVVVLSVWCRYSTI